MRRRPVLLVDQYPWHAPILDPLAHRLAERGPMERCSAGALLAGWRPRRRPALTVVADAGAIRALRGCLPRSPFMHLGHGLISKNEPARYYAEADYVCVASEAVARRLRRAGIAPRRRYIATGLIQSDPLFRAVPGCQPVRIPGCRLTIAWTPTWNPSLSSASMFGSSLVRRIRGRRADIGLVIKPHPHIGRVRPHWLARWRQWAREHPNVRLEPEAADLVPVLLGADLLVSDASSAMFLYLALNRPLVLIDNPASTREPAAFDPDGIEWRWRDIGARVRGVEDLAATVAGELAAPGRREPERLRRRAELFGELTDGRARERVVAAIDEVLVEQSGMEDVGWSGFIPRSWRICSTRATCASSGRPGLSAGT